MSSQLLRLYFSFYAYGAFAIFLISSVLLAHGREPMPHLIFGSESCSLILAFVAAAKLLCTFLALFFSGRGVKRLFQNAATAASPLTYAAFTSILAALIPVQ